MRRRSDPHHQKLNAEKSRIEAELKNTKPGAQRELLLRKLSLIETRFALTTGLRRQDCGHQSKAASVGGPFVAQVANS